ncbi:hypothetical protein Bbelb_362920 [Branchiostoma belcheri]|nr:hypothetical protein Bbelb_362920 [Branchiostoma belcheri]
MPHTAMFGMISFLLVGLATSAPSQLNKGDIAGADFERNAVEDTQLWPSGIIPYVFNSEYASACKDEHLSCPHWANIGECDVNPNYMLVNCRLSCGICEQISERSTCQDNHGSCSYWASTGECQINPNYMLVNCQASCGICQPTSTCQDNHELCYDWASIGECDVNPSYMLVNCMQSCNVCATAEPLSDQAPEEGSEAAVILAAMADFHSETCIQFVPRTTEQDYVHIRKLGGCHSAVGRQGGRQELSLANDCLQKGTIIHYLMHAIGFQHEHNRPDRDQWVQINLGNVQDGHVHDFDKNTEGRTLDLPYDYGSVMHFDSHVFSKNGLETITAKRPLSGAVMGGWRNTGFSDLDIEKINTLYQC